MAKTMGIAKYNCIIVEINHDAPYEKWEHSPENVNVNKGIRIFHFSEKKNSGHINKNEIKSSKKYIGKTLMNLVIQKDNMPLISVVYLFL